MNQSTSARPAIGVVDGEPASALAETVDANGGNAVVAPARSLATADVDVVVAPTPAAAFECVRARTDVPLLVVDGGSGLRGVPRADAPDALEHVVDGVGHDTEFALDTVERATINVDSTAATRTRALSDVMVVTSEPARISEYALAAAPRHPTPTPDQRRTTTDSSDGPTASDHDSAGQPNASDHDSAGQPTASDHDDSPGPTAEGDGRRAHDTEQVASFRADGIVVATPAGSHTYARAAGSHVLAPNTDVLAAVPIAPFATDADHWVLPNSEVTVSVERDEGDVSLRVDERHHTTLEKSDHVTITPADPVELVRTPQSTGPWSTALEKH